MKTKTSVLYAPNYKPASSNVSTAEPQFSRSIALVSIGYFFVGTLGVVNAELIEQCHTTSNNPIHYHRRSAGTNDELTAVALEPAPAQDLARIREIFRPSVPELARLFGVSRQAVYDWQNGTQPGAETVARLAHLARAANVFAGAGVLVDTQTLRRKVLGKGTILGSILNGNDAVQFAESLVQTLKREAVQRTVLSNQLGGRKPGLAYPGDYGRPAASEES